MPKKSLEEMKNSNGKLCTYCPYTEHGQHMKDIHPTQHTGGCEGFYCANAYSYYMNDDTDNVE